MWVFGVSQLLVSVGASIRCYPFDLSLPDDWSGAQAVAGTKVEEYH